MFLQPFGAVTVGQRQHAGDRPFAVVVDRPGGECAHEENRQRGETRAARPCHERDHHGQQTHGHSVDG